MLNRAEAAPYFPLYAADVLAGAEEMTHAEFGMFMRLALHSWRRCGLPTDLGRIARLLGVSSEELAEAWPIVGEPFEERDGRLVLPWQEAERERLDSTSDKRRDAANKRWERERARRAAEQEHSESTAPAEPEQEDSTPPAPAGHHPTTSNSNANALEKECLAVAVTESVADRSRSVGDLGEAPRAPAREPAAGADRPTEGGARAGTATAPGSSAPRHPVLEHADVLGWRARFYCLATPQRLADVDAQLVAAVEGGAPTDDGRVARCTPEVLTGLCRDMAAAARDPDDPEAAVVWLLRNVASGKQPKALRSRLAAEHRSQQRQAAATAHRATLPDPAALSRGELTAARRLVGRFMERWPEEFSRLRTQAEQGLPHLQDTAAHEALVEGVLIPLVQRRYAELYQSPSPTQAGAEPAAHTLAGAAT